uniref:Uncharacterized protein n=1 Tax=Arundo donax TaxID=35708 RepID=A0A0A9BPQ3_ARUDO
MEILLMEGVRCKCEKIFLRSILINGGTIEVSLEMHIWFTIKDIFVKAPLRKRKKERKLL